MLAGRGAELWNQPLVPAEPVERAVPELTLDEAVKLALTRRPELAAVDTRRAENDVQRRFFRDQAKPEVNLVGTYTLSGLAGGALLAASAAVPGSTSASDAALLARLNQLSALAGLSPLDTPAPSTGSSVPPFLVGSYSSSLSNLFAWRYPTALVQLQVELPLANATAKANIAKTDILDRQIARQRQQLEQVIEVEVRNAMQAVQTSQQRLDASASARRNAAEQYESERRRFDSGLSTVFLVLERQTALVTAQGQELRARADLNQAVAELDRSIGGTLERYGVQMQPTTR